MTEILRGPRLEEIRVGHMANANASELIACVHALEVCLRDAGHRFDRGAGLQAASEVLG
jgi:aspartate aminotransferase-like enzyme